MKKLIAKAIAHKANLEKQISAAQRATGIERIKLAMHGVSPMPAHKHPAISPRTYVDAILPFIGGFGYDYDKMKLEAVDPMSVFGGHFQGYPARTSEENVSEMDRLDMLAERYTASGDMSQNLARYGRIEGLPIYVASEGKNRVELYRRHKRAIKAMITPWPFPEARHLELHKSLPFGIYYLRCTDPTFLSASALQEYMVLAYPEISVPILRKYGVKDGAGLCIRPLAHKEAYDRKRQVCQDLLCS